MANDKEKQIAFGTCAYDRMSPPKDELCNDTKILNIILSFEEALKLNLAIDECTRKLNRYKRSTKEGKRAAMTLAIHLGPNRVAVIEGRL